MSNIISRMHYWWIIFLVNVSCHEIKNDHPPVKGEIMAVEHAFMERVADRGLRDAFVYYADENAVLVRNNHLIRGKKEIMEYYEHQEDGPEIHLTWEPEFIEVAGCGDFAYTYGKYIYTVKDSTGQETSSEGIFHTVWKRQEDGSWKYVYD